MAKKLENVRLWSIVRDIKETVDEINNLNYDNIDDLEKFMESTCVKPRDWFRRTIVLSKKVADIYNQLFKKSSGMENKRKFEQRKNIYLTIKNSQNMLCEIGRAQRSDNTDRVHDLVTGLDEKLDKLLSVI
jgi:hypothetical protein